ncbi:MAG: FHA domain-containing protein [Okeania sp. SIO2H7]|mgnify:CR=1 FL=1|nr:FHA domain-containing protein [Okeania sp. SIO2H7]
MSVSCPLCYYDRNPKNSRFCEVCGTEISSIESLPTPIENPTNLSQNTGIPTKIPTGPPPTMEVAKNVGLAKLIPKQVGAPISEFVLDSERAIAGKFDPNTGPVEIDLSGFYGRENVSAQHAEIYREGEGWKIKDLGSTTGTFIKVFGGSGYQKVTEAQTLNSGDEITIGNIRLLFQK